MIDPVTALATATSAFNLIKKGFEVGRDVESMGQDLGRWMSAMSDLKKADEYAKKPPLFKKIFQSGSVEEEAMAAFMAKKKAEDMRDQLRTLITYTRGPSAWQELIKMEGDIRQKRQQMIYDQKERQKAFFEVTAVVVLLSIMAGLIGWGIWFIMKHKGLV